MIFKEQLVVKIFALISHFKCIFLIQQSNKSATTTEEEFDLTSTEEDTIDDVQALVRQVILSREIDICFVYV